MKATSDQQERRYDAIVVGGGVSGSTTAAALAAKGMSVLLCEAGLPSEKRLAGELMHAPAARNLESVGLLAPLIEAGAVPIYGFALFRGPDDPGSLLSYTEVPGGWQCGLAIAHDQLNRTLLDAIKQRPGVEVLDGATVTSVDLDRPDPIATIKTEAGEIRARADLIVLAEGRSSAIRKSGGIEVVEGPPFRMIGWRIPGARLPYPGFGHIFTGGPAAILAYPMARDEVRIMFEVDPDDQVGLAAQVALLPQPFRADVEAAIAAGTRQVAKVFAVTPHRVANGRLAIVGDAGGCVHPLTASGIAFCTRDAIDLAEQLGDRRAPIPEALKRYDEARREPMRTRAALGPALVEALTATTPEMELLRHGLFRYWQHSPRGRAASMALLSTEEPRMMVMAREYAAVCWHAISDLGSAPVPRAQRLGAVAGLVRRSFDFATRVRRN